MKKFGKTMVVLLVILVLGLGSTSTYTTYENEFAAVKQFGKLVKINEHAGLNFKVPFIQSVTYMPKSKQLYDVPASEVITSDKKTMVTDAYVLWHVTDPQKYISSLNANSATAEGRINAIVYNAIKTTASSMTQEDLIACRDSNMDIQTDASALDDVDIKDLTSEEGADTEASEVIEKEEVASKEGPKVISEILKKEIGTQLDQYGIVLDTIKIKVLDLSDENKAAVYQRMISERNNIEAAYKAQGEADAQVIRNTTDAEVQVLLSEASAKADAIIAEGEAEYMKIMSDVYNSEDKADFYTFSLELDTAKSSLTGNNTTLFLDRDSSIAQIFAQ
ncbi:MAG: protease modulator HflC [Dorea sp.]|nr:protease modulator HflC [Dorea sp.]